MSILRSLKGPADLRALSLDQLAELAAEMRAELMSVVSKTGGHLAPNLGVVELTIALHAVFDFSHDRLLFDVGHQCYPHKLLTGRLPMFQKLRQRGGMAGFPETSESSYDLFRVGHAGTAISTAVGMARGDSLTGEGFDPKTNPDGRRTVALVGDASIVNGVAMEGLNAAGILKRQFLVVLNDNGMSISRPQGALSQYFDRLRVSHTYADLKKSAARVLRRVPGGSLLHGAYHKLGEAAKAMVNQGAWFEHFGLLTIGPIDGHDLPTLIGFLTEARDAERPMVLHVKTVKGKGFDFAEEDSEKFHSPNPFEVAPGRVEIKPSGRSFTTAAGEAVLELMRRDPKVVCATAAMPDGTGLSRAIAAFPDRAFDTGICESHAMDMMGGLARAGLAPFFAVYSTFLQRAFDQAFQEVALQGLPVRLLLDRAGLVGGDGAVHHGFCDVALLRVLPGSVLMAPIDEPSLRGAIDFMRSYEEGLSAARYPRDRVPTPHPASSSPYVLGRAVPLTTDPERADVAVLAFGMPAHAALDAARALASECRVGVYDARFAKPVDADLIASLMDRGIPIITVEEHSIIGGFGSAVLECASELAASGRGLAGRGLVTPRVARLGLPDSWIGHGTRAEQLAEAGLDEAGITRAIRTVLDGASGVREPAPSARAP